MPGNEVFDQARAAIGKRQHGLLLRLAQHFAEVPCPAQILELQCQIDAAVGGQLALAGGAWAVGRIAVEQSQQSDFLPGLLQLGRYGMSDEATQ